MYCCRQKNGSRRFCVCYRHTLNRHIIRKTWPMPGLESCLDAVGQALFISLTDFQSAFWQLPVVEEHVDRTAFVTRAGKYCFIFYECRLERLMRRGFSTCYVFGSWSPWSWVWCSLLHG